MHTTFFVCDDLVGGSHIYIPCFQPISIYVNIWSIKGMCLTNDFHLFARLMYRDKVRFRFYHFHLLACFLLYLALKAFTFSSERVWDVLQTKFFHMSQDNTPLFKAAYLVPVRALKARQWQLSKNDALICHTASRIYRAADASIHGCWTFQQ